MLSAGALIRYICAGRDIRVIRHGDGMRIVTVCGRMGSLDQDFEVSTHDHDTIMSDLVQKIAAHPDLRVAVKQDFFGKQWVEVRSGLFRLRVSRLVILPRYIQMLQHCVTSQLPLQAAV